MRVADLQRQYLKEDEEFRNFACALKLGIAFASNVGGLGTLVGSGPSIVFKGQVEAYVYWSNNSHNLYFVTAP